MDRIRIACAGALTVIAVLLVWPVLGWFFEAVVFFLWAIALVIFWSIQWIDHLTRYLMLIITGGALAAFLWLTRGR